MMKRIKTATLNLRIDPGLKAAVERAASADRRSVTSLVEKLIADWLATQGNAHADPAAPSEAEAIPVKLGDDAAGF